MFRDLTRLTKRAIRNQGSLSLAKRQCIIYFGVNYVAEITEIARIYRELNLKPSRHVFNLTEKHIPFVYRDPLFALFQGMIKATDRRFHEIFDVDQRMNLWIKG